MERSLNKYIAKAAKRGKDGKYYYISRDASFWLSRAKECYSFSHYVIGATLKALEERDRFHEVHINPIGSL